MAGPLRDDRRGVGAQGRAADLALGTITALCCAWLVVYKALRRRRAAAWLLACVAVLSTLAALRHGGFVAPLAVSDQLRHVPERAGVRVPFLLARVHEELRVGSREGRRQRDRRDVLVVESHARSERGSHANAT